MLIFTAQRAGVLASEPDFFDPDGYYFPAADLSVSGYKIDWVGLTTMNYYYDGDTHYDKPQLLSPTAELVLTRVVDQSRSKFDCPQPVVSRDLLVVVCRSTPIGVVSIRGTFIDKRGQFWNQSDIVSRKTIIVNATLTISKGGSDQVPRRVSFTYWEGD
jgi:hypothetical protein